MLWPASASLARPEATESDNGVDHPGKDGVVDCVDDDDEQDARAPVPPPTAEPEASTEAVEGAEAGEEENGHGAEATAPLGATATVVGNAIVSDIHNRIIDRIGAKTEAGQEIEITGCGRP